MKYATKGKQMNKNSIIKTTSMLLGGSAVASIGFSIGRDMYKNLKKNFKVLVIIMLIFVSVMGAYTAGVWITRNYKTIYGAIFARLGSIIVLIPSFAVLGATHLFVDLLLKSEGEKANSVVFYQTVKNNPNLFFDEIINNISTPMNIPIIVPIVIFTIGLIVGYMHRLKRIKVWDAQKSNILFMENNKLVENQDMTIDDTINGETYRIEHTGTKRITLMPLGRRGKRAYITIDEAGKYSSFSGIVKL